MCSNSSESATAATIGVSPEHLDALDRRGVAVGPAGELVRVVADARDLAGALAAQIGGREAPGVGYDRPMGLLVGIVNLVVLLFIIEAWVNGRIPGVLAKVMDERLNDPASPANTRLDRLERRTGETGARLDGLDRRLDDLDARLDGLGRRLDDFGARLDGLGGLLSELDTRVGGLDTRLDRVDAQVAVLNAQTSQQISDLDRRVRDRLRTLKRRESTREAAAEDGSAGT